MNINSIKRYLQTVYEYFLYFDTALEETAASIQSIWLKTNSVKANILSATTFFLKVNNTKVSIILESQSGWPLT